MEDIEPVDRGRLLRDIRTLLSDPVREESQLGGKLIFIGGDPGEVIVRVGPKKVSVAIFSVRWEGPHTPVVYPKELAVLNWKRIPAAQMLMTLHTMIESARELRRSRYRKCERCGETNPPEWMHDERTCQSCAEEHLGVVY